MLGLTKFNMQRINSTAHPGYETLVLIVLS